MFSANQLMAVTDDILQYLQDNLVIFLIIAAALLAVIIVIIIYSVAKKKKKTPVSDVETAATETEPDAAAETQSEPAAATETDAGVTAQVQTETEQKEGVAAQTEPAASASLTVRVPGELQTVQPQQAQTLASDAAQPSDQAAENAVSPEPIPEAIEPKTDSSAEETEVIVDRGITFAEEEPEEDETAVVQAEDDNAPVPYAGKWEVLKLSATDALGNEKESAFFFRLKASNGESLITSEDYTSLRGAWQGIETFKSNIERGNFKISITRKGKFIVKLLTNQGNLLAQGEKYSTRTQAMSAIASIKRFAETAIRDDEVKAVSVPYRESVETERTYDPEKRGKWVIHKVIMESENEASYCFELRASNGQVLFTSEEYATVASLKNGIKTHKKNIENGNIRAAITRNGDYIFKIFSGNGQLLCLGGHYKTRQLCESAIESVKHFAMDAKLDLDKLFPDEK